jgi:hypothetical protein
VLALQGLQVGYAPPGYLTLTVQGQAQRFVPTGQPGLFKSADGPNAILFETEAGQPRLITAGFAADRASFLEQASTLGVIAALALMAALATLLGLVLRFGRNLPKTGLQAVAGHVQSGSAALLLLGTMAFASFAVRASDATKIIFDWPAPAVVAASSLWLAASLLVLVTLGLLVPVWMGSGGWTMWRKLRFAATTVLFLALAFVLAMRGALVPWMA